MLVSIRDLSCLSSSGVHNLLAVLLFIATISPSPSALAPADKETGNDYHDHDQPESCDDPRHIFALALVHFAFAFSPSFGRFPFSLIPRRLAFRSIVSTEVRKIAAAFSSVAEVAAI